MHEKEGVIKSTGPEMRRFFFSVDEAVKLVLTSVENINAIHGKVLSRYMKAAQVGDLLDLWIAEKGGSWERMEGRPGERIDEFLIGDIELPYTREVEYDGIQHYVIAFNEKSEAPPEVGLSSANTERLSKEEMSRLINSPRE
jgi:UDP-glucose 4-epimerase